MESEKCYCTELEVTKLQFQEGERPNSRRPFMTTFECQPTYFKVSKLLASGGFGHVHQCYINDTVCVRKTLHNVNYYTQLDFTRECDLLAKLNHENIVSVITLFKYVNGNVKEMYLQYAGTTIIDAIEEESVFICKESVCMQITRGVSYLHDNDICHRDLKLENICIDSEGVVRIIDFGMCCQSWKSMNRLCGSINYMAPEIYMRTSYDGKKVDSWSLGVCFFAIYFKAFPYNLPCEKKCWRFGRIKKAQESLNTSLGTVKTILSTHDADVSTPPPEMEAFMDALLCVDPSRRIYVSIVNTSYPHS